MSFKFAEIFPRTVRDERPDADRLVDRCFDVEKYGTPWCHSGSGSRRTIRQRGEDDLCKHRCGGDRSLNLENDFRGHTIFYDLTGE